MKEAELRKYTVCGLCQQKIGASSCSTFYRVTLERFIRDPGAVQRKSVMHKESFIFCEDCSISKNYCMAAMAEVATPMQKVS